MKILDANEIAQNEANILSRLNHENLIKYYEHFEFGINETSRKICIVTEFCEVILVSYFEYNILFYFFFHLKN